MQKLTFCPIHFFNGRKNGALIHYKKQMLTEADFKGYEWMIVPFHFSMRGIYDCFSPVSGWIKNKQSTCVKGCSYTVH